MSVQNGKFVLRGSTSGSPFKMGEKEKYFAWDRIGKKFSPLKPAALVFQSLAFKCPAREVLTITCCTSLQVRNGLGKDKVRIIVPKKRKKMGEAESHKQIKKAKAKWQSTKIQGSAIWVWGKQRPNAALVLNTEKWHSCEGGRRCNLKFKK